MEAARLALLGVLGEYAEDAAAQEEENEEEENEEEEEEEKGGEEDGLSWGARRGVRVFYTEDPLAPRVGGEPVLPPGVAPPVRAPACGTCGAERLLVLQGAAPLPPHTPPPRVRRLLLLFVCVSPGCANSASGWYALRVSWCVPEREERVHGAPPPAPTQPSESPQPHEARTSAPSVGVWGAVAAAAVAAADAQDSEASGAASNSASSLGALEALLQQRDSKLKTAAVVRTPQRRHTAATETTREHDPPTVFASTPRAFVSSFLSLFPEPPPVRLSDDADARRREAAVVSKYLHAAEADDGDCDGEDGGDGGAGAGAGAVPAGWDGEEYEATTDPFYKFQKRFSRCREQVVRWGGRPLWMSAAPARAPPACPLCGGARVFELEVLASILALGGLELRTRRRAPGALEFGVATVFVCAHDCSPDACCVEYVEVQEAV